MKDIENLLLYFYNIKPSNLNCNNNNYSFYVDYNLYYLVKIIRPSEDILIINKIISSYNNLYHKIIINKFGLYISDLKKEKYVLLKTVYPIYQEIDLMDIVRNQKTVQNYKVLNRTNYEELWSSKVDYLEYQVKELGIKHKTIQKSFNYYVGLAENAVHYFNLINTSNEKLVISTKRVYYPNYSKDYYNPINIVIDYRIRDIAEYIKSSFFKGNDILNEVNRLIELNILNNVEYSLLYARLLFPTYYFDKVSYILENNQDDDILIEILDKASMYEELLNKIYIMINKKTAITAIDWLNR